jgi:hypothetical protein
MTALARPAAIVKDRSILLLERMLYKDYNRKFSAEKRILVVSVKELFADKNSDSDSDSD